MQVILSGIMRMVVALSNHMNIAVVDDPHNSIISAVSAHLYDDDQDSGIEGAEFANKHNGNVIRLCIASETGREMVVRYWMYTESELEKLEGDVPTSEPYKPESDDFAVGNNTDIGFLSDRFVNFLIHNVKPTSLGGEGV